MQDGNFFFIHNLKNVGLHTKFNTFCTAIFWKI